MIGRLRLGKAFQVGALAAVALTIGAATAAPEALASTVAAASSSSDPDAAALADDDGHPIPKVNVVDIIAAKADASEIELVMVIASPLPGDTRSLLRLARKLDNYATYAHSVEFVAKHPPSTKVSIRVVIVASSDPAAFGLLERARPLLLQDGLTLSIDTTSLK